MSITTLYFVRHAESDRSVRDGRIRPLTKRGLVDAEKLISNFENISVDIIYSSPFKRAIGTITPLAGNRNLEIHTIEDLRERRSDSVQSIDLIEMIKMQWKDFSFTLSDGECLNEVQERNIKAIFKLLEQNSGKSIAIATHGMALCTIMQYFNPSMSIEDVGNILPVMPYVFEMKFENTEFISQKRLFAEN